MLTREEKVRSLIDYLKKKMQVTGQFRNRSIHMNSEDCFAVL